MAVRQRIVAGSAAQLIWQAVDQYGEPSDPGTTTVAVVRSDGTTVHAAGTATTTPSGTTRRAVALTAADNIVDQLTATWSGANAAGETTIDVVGGVYFSASELRQFQPLVAVKSDHPDETVYVWRQIVETIFENASGLAFVPRWQVCRPSAGRIVMRGVRSVRWVELDDDAGTIVDSGLDDYVEITPEGVACISSVERVGLVHGIDTPADVWRASMLACRHLLTSGVERTDFRPMQVTNPDGSVDQYATPGVAQWVLGIPEVDEVINRYRPRRQLRSIQVAPWVGR